MYTPEKDWIAHQVLDAVDPAAARAALGAGKAWIVETALPQVPAEFRDSFLRRNPLNRQLLAAAGRVGIA